MCNKELYFLQLELLTVVYLLLFKFVKNFYMLKSNCLTIWSEILLLGLYFY